jgi:L,D-peptidoglycan transpeptidase YkuD (ErfK/YbiS/YcfS/YnhG family)
MQIIVKNKDTLIFDQFKFKCSMGKKGITSKKIEGDEKTPKGTYSLGPLYFRKDRLSKPPTKLKTLKIKTNIGWCDDIDSELYNKPIKINKRIRFEKLFRKNKNYDLLIPIQYNTTKPIKNKGSAIFLHLTKNYKKTLGCIALRKKDMLILLRLINKKTKIKII